MKCTYSSDKCCSIVICSYALCYAAFRLIESFVVLTSIVPSAFMGISLSDSSYNPSLHLTISHTPNLMPSECIIFIPFEEQAHLLVVQRSLEDPDLSVGNSTGYTRHLNIAWLNLRTD